jgi:hypothetical protein
MSPINFRRQSAPSIWTRPREQGRASRHERGYDAAWDRLAKRFLRRYPFCRFSEQDGFETILAVTVDHIIPVEDAPELRLVWGDLQSLSTKHHYDTKARLERIARAEDRLDELVAWCAEPQLRRAVLHRGS